MFYREFIIQGIHSTMLIRVLFFDLRECSDHEVHAIRKDDGRINIIKKIPLTSYLHARISNDLIIRHLFSTIAMPDLPKTGRSCTYNEYSLSVTSVINIIGLYSLKR